MRRELLAGCGSNRDKKLCAEGYETWTNLTTLDINPAHDPDVLADLNKKLPFEDETFDEIHAYEVLEHLGQQGDAASFFSLFSEFYRIMKPGGSFFGSTPRWDGQWAWADPSHRRIISEGTLLFLDQKLYVQVGKTTMTDFRSIWKGNFEHMWMSKDDVSLSFVLEKR